MKKPKAVENMIYDPEIESYDELKWLLNNEQELEVKKFLAKMEKLKENFKTIRKENEGFRKQKEKLLSENKKQLTEIENFLTKIKELEDDNQKYIEKLDKIKASKKKVRKEVILEDHVLGLVTQFFEDSLKNKRISHFKLKQQIEKYLKLASDREVLYFILQQTILYKRGMVIIKEKELIEGVRSKYRIWTAGTELSDKTVRQSIRCLESIGFIFRFKENKHKVIYFINVNKSRVIYDLLTSKEVDFEDVKHFLDIDMRNKKITFDDFPLKHEDLPVTTNRPSGSKQKTFPEKSVTPPDSKIDEKQNLQESQKLSTIYINNSINDIINNKQTNQEADSEQNYIGDKIIKDKMVSSDKKELLLQSLKIWKLTEQIAGTLLGRKGDKLTYSEFIEALKERIKLPAREIIKNESQLSINSELAIIKEKFFSGIYEMLDLLNIEPTGSSIPELVESTITGIDCYLGEE